MALALRDFNFMSPTSCFLLNGKENARKIFFFSPDEKTGLKSLHESVCTPNAKFMTLDLKDFYLMTPMKRYEYFCMKLDLFPQDIIDKYD
jgi:hypothetical protein